MNSTTVHRILLAVLAVFVFSTISAQLASVSSPDGRARLSVETDNDGQLLFSLSVDGTEVLSHSRMGFDCEEDVLPSGWHLDGITRASQQSVWRPLWGKRSEVRDEYNEMSLHYSKVGKAVTFNLRAYNDGAAWNCEFGKGSFNVEEKSCFNFSADYTAWYYNGENHNVGPELLSDAHGNRQPLMTVQATDRLFLAVHEAKLYKGKPMLLHSEKGSTRLDIVSEPTKYSEGESTAWRLVMYGRTPGNLVDSHVIELLNPEAEGDYSWVHPGIYLWDWRIDGAEWDGYHYGMNYDSWIRMVDFAREQGFTGLVLDANWYGPEFELDSNPTTGDKARDVQRIIQYGKERGVDLWLYLNDVAGSNYPIEETLKQYESWGAAGVKYGFMEGTYTERNLKTLEITRLCAKHHLCVDFHDYPVHPWGQCRTWPNAITREYCKAQLDGHQIFYPKTFVTSAFVNMVAGPIDQNNGFFDLRQGGTTRVDNPQEAPTTVCAEAARVFITYSGADVIPDIPEMYRKHPTLLKFLARQKQPWLESRTLSGEIGKYIVMSRQACDSTWLVAAATNEEARTVSVDLSFLPQGTYLLKITEDAPDAHYLTNREVTQYREESITIDEKTPPVSLNMQPGGGACMIIEKK